MAYNIAYHIPGAWSTAAMSCYTSVQCTVTLPRLHCYDSHRGFSSHGPRSTYMSKSPVLCVVRQLQHIDEALLPTLFAGPTGSTGPTGPTGMTVPWNVELPSYKPLVVDEDLHVLRLQASGRLPQPVQLTHGCVSHCTPQAKWYVARFSTVRLPIARKTQVSAYLSVWLL
jgi:hypothetical protein